MPETLLELLVEIIAELLIGLLLGWGVMLLFTVVQLAGELIDQQTGIALGEVFNPGLEIMAGVTGRFLFLYTLVVMFCLEPVGGHLMMIDTIVQTFQVLPVGSAPLHGPIVDLGTDLLSQSFLLLIQIIAPFFAAMSLVSLTLGFLGYTVPQINVMTIGFAVRATINIALLAVTISGVGLHILNWLPEWIESILPLWIGSGNGGG